MTITAPLAAATLIRQESMGLAASIRARLDVDAELIGSAEVVFPGYINITFTPLFFAEGLRHIAGRLDGPSDGTPLPASYATGPLLRLAHARLAGILRHAGQLQIPVRLACDMSPLLAFGDDCELARRVTTFTESRRNPARLVPNPRAHDALALAVERFYYGSRVVASEPLLRDARLALAGITARVIEESPM